MPAKISLSIAKTAKEKRAADKILEAVLRHGATTPLRLESRRKMVSSWALAIQTFVNRLHTRQKYLALQNEKAIEALRAAICPDMDEKTKAQSVEAAANAATEQQMAIDILIMQFQAQLALIETNCIMIDCMSLRLPGRGKRTGKKGFYRYSMARYAQDTGFNTIFLCACLEKIMEHLKIEVPEDPFADDDETVVEDEEVETEVDLG